MTPITSADQSSVASSVRCLNTVELFSATESFSKVMRSRGHSTFTVEIDRNFSPDLVADILVLDRYKLPTNADLFWASPPCTGFSIAARGRNWTLDIPPKPKTYTAELGIKLVEKTLSLIEDTYPKWWFIENPRGVLRKLDVMTQFDTPDIRNNNKYGVVKRHTIWYCQYGDVRAKPTDIWTNAYWWKPRPECKNGNKDHQAAPRGSKTGTQGLKGAKERSVIPPQLFEEILEQMPV